MIAPLAKWIDWSTLQVVTMMIPASKAQQPRLEEALEFLKGPDFASAETQAAQVEFHGPAHFRFPTPRPCEFAENNVAYGRLYRCSERWQVRPVIVLLHGKNNFIGYRFQFPLVARHCNRAGFNAATWVAPYHFRRHPRQLRESSSPDYLRLAEATVQAVAELRALTGWLLAEGCPAVALWGNSMGGWLAGLTACRDARLAAAVLMKPAVRPNPSIGELILWPRLRAALRRLRVADEMLEATPMNLTASQPAVAKGNILLIEGMHDLFTPPEPLENLWQTWGRPEIWRLPHGHISLSLRPGLTDRVIRWLAPRLDKSAVPTGS